MQQKMVLFSVVGESKISLLFDFGGIETVQTQMQTFLNEKSNYRIQFTNHVHIQKTLYLQLYLLVCYVRSLGFIIHYENLYFQCLRS